MKNTLYKYLRTSLILLLLILFLQVDAQTVTKSTTSPTSGAVCPESITEYSVNIPGGFQTCSRLWTATNGQIEGSATGVTVRVKWNDTPGAKGKITCTFSNCGNSNDNTAPFSEELILSVKNQQWGTFGTSVDIDFCTPASGFITVPRMFVQGTGGIAEPTLLPGWYSV